MDSTYNAVEKAVGHAVSAVERIGDSQQVEEKIVRAVLYTALEGELGEERADEVMAIALRRFKKRATVKTC